MCAVLHVDSNFLYIAISQLERELAGMRTTGVDLRQKQAEIDAARRSAAEAQEALVAAQRCSFLP